MNQNNKIWVVCMLVFGGIFSRLLPHPANFSPIAAIGLFSGVYLTNKYAKYLIPFVALYLSDLILNNTIYAKHGSSFSFFYEGFY